MQCSLLGARSSPHLKKIPTPILDARTGDMMQNLHFVRDKPSNSSVVFRRRRRFCAARNTRNLRSAFGSSVRRLGIDGLDRMEEAELITLGIGQHSPGDVALPDVGRRCPDLEKSR